jgi:hypothetical protein
VNVKSSDGNSGCSSIDGHEMIITAVVTAAAAVLLMGECNC